jgi:hypothetical protein
MTLRNTRINQKHALETRKVQLYMQLLDRFSSEENRLRSIQVQQMEYKNYDDYWKKWGMFKDPESAAKRMHIWTELDGLGQLLRGGLIDLDFIPRIIHAVVINQWDKWGQLIIESARAGKRN